MWNKIEELDLFIIEEFEKVTHFIQRNTGIDNFNLIHILAGLISLFSFYFCDNFDINFVIQSVIFWFLSYKFVIKNIPNIKERVYKDLEDGYQNYLVAEKIGERLFANILVFCFLLIGSYIDKVSDLFSLFVLIEQYLISCTPIDMSLTNKDTLSDTA